MDQSQAERPSLLKGTQHWLGCGARFTTTKSNSRGCACHCTMAKLRAVGLPGHAARGSSISPLPLPTAVEGRVVNNWS